MSKNKHILVSVIMVIGVAAIMFAALGLYDYYHVTHSGSSIPNQTTVTDDETVSEKPVTVNDSYQVPAHQPRVINIPSLNVNAYVQRVGVTKDMAMATPNNINFTGWYVNNPSPGEVGVSIINGHAGGRYTDGVFKHLNQLKQGDAIKIQMGDLSWRDFSVVSVGVYPVAEATKGLYKDDPSIDKELHLITCDGKFDDKTQTYDKRAIVVAKYTT